VACVHARARAFVSVCVRACVCERACGCVRECVLVEGRRGEGRGGAGRGLADTRRDAHDRRIGARAEVDDAIVEARVLRRRRTGHKPNPRGFATGRRGAGKGRGSALEDLADAHILQVALLVLLLELGFGAGRVG
jgi:hypothetical protein